VPSEAHRFHTDCVKLMVVLIFVDLVKGCE